MEQLDARRAISLYPSYDYKGYQWGMAIDLNACTGCSACVVACVAENNIPVVGKDAGAARAARCTGCASTATTRAIIDNPDTYHQPMPCQQCENAPCEVVCPVAATVHSDEGLNDMVYNRCVGTRYCSNNCPYKVRRFNFLLYAGLEHAEPEAAAQSRRHRPQPRRDGEVHLLRAAHQPRARIEAKLEEREIRDGEVVTACQPACPTDAIVFGNINDPESQVAKLQGRAAQLRGARRAQHAAADHVSRGGPQPESGAAAGEAP